MALTVEKCIQGWTNSLRQMKTKADIVFFGDSLVYYGEFAHLFPNCLICNLGLRGDTLQGLIDRVEQVEILHPKVVLLLSGINDITKVTESEFGVLYEKLIEKLLGCRQGIRLIIQSMMPVNNMDFSISCNNDQVKSYNAIIAEMANKYNLEFVDLYSVYEKNSLLPKESTIDGIHLLPKQYEQWYQVIKNIV